MPSVSRRTFGLAHCLQALAKERERLRKAELLALEAQMQAKLEALTRSQ